MANAVDRIFDEILPKLQLDINTDELPVPDYPEHDDHDSFNANDNDIVSPLSDVDLADEVLSRINSTILDTYPSLSNDDRKLLAGGIRHYGFEALAFYKSKRFINQNPYPGKWGIFYIKHGISYIRDLISAKYSGYGNPKKLAIEFLRQHERFHYQFDLQTLSSEAITGKHLYEPLKRGFAKHKIYLVEEALANQQAWNWAKQQHIGIKEFAEDFMSVQPGAYARFDERFAELSAELTANLHDRNYSRNARRFDVAPWVGLLPKNLLRDSLCPEWVVSPASLNRWISPIVRMPDIKSINDSIRVSKALDGRLINYKQKWEKVKSTLKSAPELLFDTHRFKLWDTRAGIWSVQVDGNYRAHLLNQGAGNWLTEDLDNHKAMGHG